MAVAWRGPPGSTGQIARSFSRAGIVLSEAEVESIEPYAAAIARISAVVDEVSWQESGRLANAGSRWGSLPGGESGGRSLGSRRKEARVPGSAVTAAKASLDRISRLDGQLHAVAQLLEDPALGAAKSADRVAAVARGPLHGMPILVKDVIDVEGCATRANCRALSDGRAARDAVAVDGLRRAGCVPLGKATCWELSVAETDDRSSLFLRALNPWSPEHDTGGSSSGCAAAVAAGYCPTALATDTGGSTRGPAAWCGVVGYKASHALFPSDGILPLSPSFDCLGVVADSVPLCARVAQSLSQRHLEFDAFDPNDAEAERHLKGCRIGVWRDAYERAAPASAAVRSAFELALARLGGCGAELVDVDLPSLEAFSATFVLLARAETFLQFRELLAAKRHLIGATARGRLLASGLIDDVMVGKARALLPRLRRAVSSAMEQLEAIVMPTMPSCALPLAEAGVPMSFDKPSYVRFASLLGLPSISVPCGLSDEGLPVGFMINGAAGEDLRLFRLAAAIARVMPRISPDLAWMTSRRESGRSSPPRLLREQ